MGDEAFRVLYTALMKYFGIDYGARFVGIAVSNNEGTIAFPRTTFQNDKDLLPTLVQAIRYENAEAIVVGDTRTHGGGENPITKKVEQLIVDLARETGLPISRGFEVFSSIEASRHAPKGRGHDDSAAAAVILQRFLDMKGGGVESDDA